MDSTQTDHLSPDARSIRVYPQPGRILELRDFERTPIGAFPEILLQKLGAFYPTLRALSPQVTPWCHGCQCSVPVVERSAAVANALKLATEKLSGYLVMVAPAASELDLVSYMEMLDVERAVIEGKLVTKDQLQHERGMPVLSVSPVSAAEETRAQLTDWFSRGGESATLLWFDNRDSVGETIAQIDACPRCPGCGQVLPVFDVRASMGKEPCSRCRGNGWILTESEMGTRELRACRDCDGFGSQNIFWGYRLRERTIGEIGSLSHVDLFQMVESRLSSSIDPRDHQAVRVLEALVQSPFRNYCLGTPAATLTRSESAQLTALHAQLIRYNRKPLVFDCQRLGLTSKGSRDFLESTARTTSIVVECGGEMNDGVLRDRGESLRQGVIDCWVRAISANSLTCEKFSFPYQGLSLVVGEPGSGKTTLLKEVIRPIFRRRKKFTHRCDFQGCTNVELLEADIDRPLNVGSLLNLQSDVVEMFASTLIGKKLGVCASDIAIPITTCSGNGCQLCSSRTKEVALSDIMDSRMPLLKVGGTSLAELVLLPLKDIFGVVVLDQRQEEIIKDALTYLPPETTLSSCIGALEFDTIRFLFFYSRIKRHLRTSLSGRAGGAKASSSKGALVLVDAPFTGNASFDAVVLRELRQLAEEGITVVCTDSVSRYRSSFDRTFILTEQARSRTGVEIFQARVCRQFEPIQLVN